MSDLQPDLPACLDAEDPALSEADDSVQLVRGTSEHEARAEAIRYHIEALEDLADPASRIDGWTPFARRLFLQALAETGRVTTACDTAGLTKQSAYALRARDPLFAAGWDAACELARMPLADALYERAIEGVTETIERNGEIVATRHRHDSRLSVAVLHRLDKRCDRAEERGAKHRRAVARWDDYIRAIGQDDAEEARAILERRKNSPHSQASQLPPPDEAADPLLNNRLWWDSIVDDWRTDFPPPPDFDGVEHGIYGSYGYERELSPEERAPIDAEAAEIAALEAAEDATRRDRFFAELAEEISPTPTNPC